MPSTGEDQKPKAVSQFAAFLNNAAAGLRGHQYAPTSSSISSAPSSTASAFSISYPPSTPSSLTLSSVNTVPFSGPSFKARKRARGSIDAPTDVPPQKQMRRPGEDVMNVDDHRTISMTEAGSTARAVDDAENSWNGHVKAKARADEEESPVLNKGKGKVEQTPLPLVYSNRQYEEVQPRPTYPQNNTKRREKRTQDADLRNGPIAHRSNPFQADLACKVWSREVDGLLSRYNAVETASIHTLTDIDVFSTVYKTNINFDGLCPATGDSSELLRDVDHSTIAFLANVGRNPLDVRVQQAITQGILVPSLEEHGEADMEGTGFYWRQLSFKAAPEETRAAFLEKVILRYLGSFPADIAWGTYILLVLGLDLAEIQRKVGNILSQLQYECITSPYFDSINSLPSFRTFTPPKLASSIEFGYGGESGSVPAWKRVQQDLDQSIQSRYGNILKANEGFLEAVAYDIPGLRLRSSPGIKLDPVASLREYGLVGLFRAVAMNSATGGWSRRFAAPHWALQLRDVLLSRPVVRFTGPEQPHFTNKLNLIFRDETEFLRRRGYLPAPTHIITNTMATAAAAIRSHSPTWTPFLRWMKAIPAEELALRIGSMWSADAGRALIEHRNILSQMYPFQTLPDGSVDGSGVPLWLGPSLDFWRWLLEHILFWLHLLWMGRLLFFTRPLIISGWGTTMFYIIQRNLLSHVWNYIPDNARTLLLSGQTPDNILDLLPTASHEKWYPEADGGEFLDAVGTLLIVSCGLDDRVLSLYVPQLHPGAAKYTPKEAPLMEKISYCTELINAVAVEEVEVHRLRGVVPCHENVEASWTYMQALRNAIEDRIVSSGLRAKLDDLKTELGQIQATDRHFRTLLKSTQFVPRGPQGRPVIFKLAARADQRRQQFEHLIAISVVNARGGLDPDPFSLVPRPWKDSIGCDDHLAWFLSLKEGTSISHSARNFANSLESYERVLDNQKAIGVWRRTKAVQDRIGTTKDLQALSSAMQDLQDPRGKAVRPLNRSFRCATCRTCGRIVVGHNDKSVHTCNDQEHTLTAKNFPDLDRLLYPHDILSRPDLLNLFALADEPFMDIINRLQSQFGLSEHSASSIFAQPSTRSFLRDTLHPADVAAVERLAAAMSGDTIYVSVTEPALQMAPTIAVDWVLRQKHNLPTVLEAQMASSRRAWEDRNTTDLFEWLAKDSKRTKALHVVVCEAGLLSLTFDLQINADVVKWKHKSPAHNCDSGKGCQVHEWRRVNDLTDLPEHYARRLWFKLSVNEEKKSRGASGARGAKNKP